MKGVLRLQGFYRKVFFVIVPGSFKKRRGFRDSLTVQQKRDAVVFKVNQVIAAFRRIIKPFRCNQGLLYQPFA